MVVDHGMHSVTSLKEGFMDAAKNKIPGEIKGVLSKDIVKKRPRPIQKQDQTPDNYSRQ
jgi:hypothetical protein